MRGPGQRGLTKYTLRDKRDLHAAAQQPDEVNNVVLGDDLTRLVHP